MSSAPLAAAPPIALSQNVCAELFAQARAEFPAECCGYLTGPAGANHVDAVVACRNAQTDGQHPLTPERGADTGFVIAGAELLAFARSFDGPTPARIVYHSHTNGRAYFSDVDRAMAAGSYPVQHLVIGVDATHVTELAQFAWSDDAQDFIEVARWQP
ncbi:MAG: Mov34/MPN/PAD-1 family protein [Kofleriaceae bacterium]|nr:Mov34/MPN/PAD-1 family protein [Kofleriaceae bacterium]